jgi:hypothetical protein
MKSVAIFGAALLYFVMQDLVGGFYSSKEKK